MIRIGLILCSDKKKTVVEYALGGMSNRIFTSKYRLRLPDPEVLKTEIEHETQRLLEMKIENETSGGVKRRKQDFLTQNGPRGNGVSELLDTAIKVAKEQIESNKKHLNYGDKLEKAHNSIIEILVMDPEFSKKYSSHWIAIKLLENDNDAIEKVKHEHSRADDVLSLAADLRRRIESHFGEESEVVVGEQRYAYIHGALQETVKRESAYSKVDRTERIDSVVLNRYGGVLIFFAIMFLIYQLTFALGNPIADFINSFFGLCNNVLKSTLPQGPLSDLLTDGIITGVGGVLVFLPIVLLLFFGLSFLEDSGYMSRAAFVMDKFLHIFGLHGRSFIPLMVSTGCAIPGVMSARVLANPKDRIVTILVSPLMMCGAKAPVIAMLAAAFFTKNAGMVFWSIWLFGWLMAFIIALIFRSTLFRGEATPFVMELPPYRMPTLRGILYHMWEKSWQYVKKAGTVILAASIVIWFILSFPRLPEDDVDEYHKTGSVNIKESRNALAQKRLIYSLGGRIGKAIEPVISKAGFDWKLGISLFAGFTAKEVIISTMGIVYGIGESDIDDENRGENVSLRDYILSDPNYTPLTALALMVFVMIYVPCIATLATVRKELGSWKWPAFMAAYTLVVAWLLAVGVYQIGILLGYGV